MTVCPLIDDNNYSMSAQEFLLLLPFTIESGILYTPAFEYTVVEYLAVVERLMAIAIV